MAVTIKHFSTEPVKMKRGDRDVFFDLIGEDLDTVHEDIKKMSGVFAATDNCGTLLPGMTINIDSSTTPTSGRITVFANPSLAISDANVGPALWVVILEGGKVVASKQGLLLTK